MNKDKVLLSIIIPVYNSEKTIKKCLTSVFTQKGFILPYEVILVDDGSTDNSQNVIASLVADKNNVSVIRQENSGAGAARNNGLRHAKGDFLFFIDADDFLSKGCLSTVFHEIQQDGTLDVLVFGYKLLNRKYNVYKKMPFRDASVYNDDKFSNKVFSFNDDSRLIECIQYPWNKIYNKKFIDDNNITFSETKVHNDLFFSMASIICANRIKIIPAALYIHVVRQTHEQISSIADNRRLDAFAVLEQCDRFVREKLYTSQQFLSFYAFKAELLEFSISLLSGPLQARFILYLRDFIHSLDAATVKALLQHRLANASLRRRIMDDSPRLAEVQVPAKHPLLSIIIPVYNVAPWLPACLESVARQTLNPELFEVILVDDRSTDDSAAICQDFCRRYSNFRFIEVAEHTVGGAGIPSNIGIDEACGDYVGFVDSDDYIEPEMFEVLLAKALQTKADLTICSFSIYNENTKCYVRTYDQPAWEELLSDFDKSPLKVTQRKALRISPVPWRKLYRRDFLNEFHIRYPEGDYFYEDNVLHWYAVVQAKSFAVADIPMITHRMARAGQTMSGSNDKLLAFCSHFSTVYDFLHKTGNYNEFRLDYLCFVMKQSEWILPKLGSLQETYLLSVRSVCKDATLSDFIQMYRTMGMGLAPLFFNYVLLHCSCRAALAARKCLKPVVRLKSYLSGIKAVARKIYTYLVYQMTDGRADGRTDGRQ